MRKNLFLQFLNRDSREIFGIYSQHDDASHFRMLRRALNAAIILCEDFCFSPPGFIVEDEIAFNLAEAQRSYLKSGVIQFPLRELNLADFAEKKRVEYQPMRNRYSGLFDDTRIGFLGRNAQGLIRRKSKIGEGIISGWRDGPDTKLRAWTPIRDLLSSSLIEQVRFIPQRLADNGVALTWSAIKPELPSEALAAAGPMRNALQHIYFKQYCQEYDLVSLTAIPQMIDDFNLPQKRNSYSYERLARFFDAFEINRLLLEGSADFIVSIRRRPGFIAFMDAYVQIAEKCKTLNELSFLSGRIAKDTRFEWLKFSARFTSFVAEPNALEILELEGGFQEAASLLTSRHELIERGSEIRDASDRIPIVARKEVVMSDVVLFVALEEELDVLARVLGLVKNFVGPAATGKIGDTPITVLCPKNMGRVAAAVEVARYLEGRRENKPKLVLIVGLAGGFTQAGTEPGHIICGTRVIDLANRKVIDTDTAGAVTKFRRQDFDLNTRLRDLLGSHAFDQKAWIDASIEKYEWPKGKRPSIHTGNLASVDEVIASHEFVEKLLANTEKLLGVEMEAGGVCAAASKFNVPVSMLRAVSDKADPAKTDDMWRSIGMKTLAELLTRISFPELLEAIKS